jgi:pilus assembly protein CpaD
MRRIFCVNKSSLVLIAALALGACATDDVANNSAPQPLTPTEHFAIEVRQQPRELKLAPHPQGLSPTQVEALGDFVDRWTDGDGGPVTVHAPQNGGDAQATGHTVEDVRAFLVERGVAPGKVRVVGYDSGGDAQAPIVVGYEVFVARGPECGREWENLTATRNNTEYANFGCATTANMAAQIANPGDVLNPRALDPTDASRRQTVLDHYRKGEKTSSDKDDQANGAISTAVH